MTGTRIFLHMFLDYANQLEHRYYINLTCLILGNLHMITTFGSCLMTNMLAVEQQLATIWVDNYENMSVRVGIILMTFVVR